MNIAGVIVHARPDRVETVRTSLGKIPGVDVHAATADGRLVVTVEDVGDGEPADTMMSIHRLDGVLSATMVYHHFEPDPCHQEMPDEADKA
jgi:nitrate reductase NapD